MILQFEVENNCSINEKQRLAFIADSKTEHEDSLINYEKYKILPTIGIYGKNASGKTNILKSFKHIRDMIRTSHDFNPAGPIPFYTPFKFTTEKNKPSNFEIIFICNEKRFAYGFSHNSNEILEEYLYIFNSSKPSKIFERKREEENDVYSFGSKYEGMEYLIERTHKNKLFLSVSSQWAAKIEEINDIFNYFENSILYYQKNCNEPSNEWRKKTTQLLIENKEARIFLKKLIKHFNLEMIDIKASNQTLNFENLPQDIQKLIEKLEGLNKGERETKEQTEIKAPKVSFVYNIDNIEYFLEFVEESNGIQKIYDIFSLLFESLTSKKVLIIDEIEMGLHPILAKELVRLFQDTKINIFGSQLLFTTHDINILDLSLLRRDQIWFVSKSIEQKYSTNLYSLGDINGVRITDNISRNYLLGKYSNTPEVQAWRDDL